MVANESIFPLSRAARKEKLKIIKAGESVGTSKVPGKGAKNVYRIPLSYLSYNPYNTRFLAQAKTLEKRFAVDLSDEVAEHVSEIEKIIWEEKKDRNANTIDSLIRDGQLQPGVVTADGIILAGNRRFRLLNEIARNPDKYNDPRVRTMGLEYFEAVILDDEMLSKKDIVRYESFYQFGAEEKVEYDPIQKYIAAYDQKDRLKFTEDEIADNFLTVTNGDKNVVKKWISVFNLMKEYLEYIGEEEIYTALEGREEAFLQLHTLLKSYSGRKASKIGWACTENDLTDLKLVFFDYIRLDTPTHAFRLFKEIFLDELQWKAFVKKQNEVVTDEQRQLKTFEEYRKLNSEDDELAVSKKRRNDYIANFKDELNNLYGNENAVVQRKKVDAKPLDILVSIQLELSKLEEAMTKKSDSKTFEEEEFVDKVRDIQKRIGKIKQKID